MSDPEEDVALGRQSGPEDEIDNPDDVATKVRVVLETIRERRGPITESLWMVRYHFALAVAVFFGWALVGYVVVGPVLSDVLAGNPSVPSADCRTPTDSFVSDTTRGYFVNNMGVSVVMMGGMGVLTVFAIAYNGLILGAGWQVAVAAMGASNPLIAACVLPHGVIEFLGLWIASAIGFFLPGRAAQYFLGLREEILDPVEEIHVLQLMGLVTVLIFVAAVVEANVSGQVARLLLGSP